jgi:GTPase
LQSEQENNMTDSRLETADLAGTPDAENVDASSTHSGFVAIVGKPNVGKSTLLNSMLGVKIAPVTSKPQTTRRGVRGIATVDNRQAIFVDTPGLHKPKDALGKYMNEEVHSALSDVDAIVWVVDLRRPPSDEDRLVARAIRGFTQPLWLVGNKLDAAKYPDEAYDNYAKLLEREDFNRVKLSAQSDPTAVANLLEEILHVIPENPFFYPQVGKSDQSREQWAAEIIREEAMNALSEEIPYSVATRVTNWTTRDNGMEVLEGEIIVEKVAHRKIVVGSGARMLKQIGQRARKQLEVFLNTKVYLALEVIVIQDWRTDAEALRELGYE